MKVKRFLAALAAVSLLGLVSPGSASAQDRNIRVAVVNVPRIFNDIEETKALDERFKQERIRLEAEQKPMIDEIKKLEAEGNNFRKGSPQHDEWRQRYAKARLGLQAWQQTAKMDLDWRRKRYTKDLYERIYAAVGDYAQQNKIDLVLADHQPIMSDEEMEKVPYDQLSAILNQRRVVYSSKAADISDPIIALLDAKYRAGGGAANAGGGARVTAPAPAASAPTGQDAASAGADLRGTPPGRPAQGKTGDR